MATKRPKKFSVSKETKRQSREAIGTPPPTRVIEDRRNKPAKYKKKEIDLDNGNNG